MRVLLVDDDRELVDLLAFALKRAGLEAVPAYDGAVAMRQMDERPPDAVVLDVNLGATSGLDLLRTIRQRSDLPAILLTALDSEDDKVRGLELGADDYLTKPFSHRELIARIRAQLRKVGQVWSAPKPAETVIQAGTVALDVAQHIVTMRGQNVSLTVTEFRLLHYLLLHAGTVVPTSVLLKHVWGYPDSAGTDVVRVTVHRLRRKLEVDPAHPRLLRTVSGVGVLYRPDATDGEVHSA